MIKKYLIKSFNKPNNLNNYKINFLLFFKKKINK